METDIWSKNKFHPENARNGHYGTNSTSWTSKI
jgi:hypothetical protein